MTAKSRHGRSRALPDDHRGAYLPPLSCFDFSCSLNFSSRFPAFSFLDSFPCLSAFSCVHFSLSLHPNPPTTSHESDSPSTRSGPKAASANFSKHGRPFEKPGTGASCPAPARPAETPCWPRMNFEKRPLKGDSMFEVRCWTFGLPPTSGPTIRLIFTGFSPF